MNMLCLLFCSFLNNDNTPLVSNPEENGPYRLVFQEDLRFGGSGHGSESLWLDGQVPVWFDVDGRGHFFVIDVVDSTLLEFNEKGAFVATVAKRGQGPGEYQNLQGFDFFGDGGAMGFDFSMPVGKFSSYGPGLRFLSTTTVQKPDQVFTRVHFSQDGRLFYAWYLSFDLETRKLHFNTGLFNRDFELAMPLSGRDWPQMDPGKAQSPDYWEGFLAGLLHGFLDRGSHFARFLSDGRVVVADATRYELEIWSQDLKTRELRIKKKYKPASFSEEDRTHLRDFVEAAVLQRAPEAKSVATPQVVDRAVEKADLPKFRNPVADVLPMEDGHFLVVHQPALGRHGFELHLFDGAGRSVGAGTFPGGGSFGLFGCRIRFKNGYAYALEQGEQGENQMVRYRYLIEQR